MSQHLLEVCVVWRWKHRRRSANRASAPHHVCWRSVVRHTAGVFSPVNTDVDDVTAEMPWKRISASWRCRTPGGQGEDLPLSSALYPADWVRRCVFPIRTPVCRPGTRAFARGGWARSPEGVGAAKPRIRTLSNTDGEICNAVHLLSREWPR